jgi:hypothetical protein
VVEKGGVKIEEDATALMEDLRFTYLDRRNNNVVSVPLADAITPKDFSNFRKALKSNGEEESKEAKQRELTMERFVLLKKLLNSNDNQRFEILHNINNITDELQKAKAENPSLYKTLKYNIPDTSGVKGQTSYIYPVISSSRGICKVIKGDSEGISPCINLSTDSLTMWVTSQKLNRSQATMASLQRAYNNPKPDQGN